MSGALKINGFYLKPTETEPAVWPSRLPFGLNLLPRLLSAARQPGAAGDSLLELISLDVELTAGVLNSARTLYGPKLRSIKTGLAQLGEREIYRLAAGVTGVTWFHRIEKNGTGARHLWRHALLCAVASQAVADHAGLDPELAYTAGLLHDIGKVLLWNEFGSEYVKMMTHFQAIDGDLCAAERNRFDLDHAKIGAGLLREWKFPRPIQSAVAYHHRAQNAQSPGGTSALCQTVHLGNALAHILSDQAPSFKAADTKAEPIPDIPSTDPLRALKLVVLEQFAKEFAILRTVFSQRPCRN
jgi:putative nucleotidyltransferase with HDIG domain